MPPPATQEGRRAIPVVDRLLDELCACLDDALSSSRQRRSPYAEARLRDRIKAKTDFLRPLLAAEAECHGGAGARPVHLAEAEARFAVLEAAFDRWARGAVVGAPEPVEEEVVVEMEEPEEEVEEEEPADCSGSCSRSTCSCTESCQEATEGDAKQREDAVEARDEEGASDGIAEDNDAEDETAEQVTDTVAMAREAMGTREEVTLDDAIAKKRDTDRGAEAEKTRKRAVQRRWWRQSAAAAWCGAACVVAVIAVGVAVELAAVAHHNVNVYVVPT